MDGRHHCTTGRGERHEQTNEHGTSNRTNHHLSPRTNPDRHRAASTLHATAERGSTQHTLHPSRGSGNVKFRAPRFPPSNEPSSANGAAIARHPPTVLSNRWADAPR